MLAAAATNAATVQGPGSLTDIWQHIVTDFSNLSDPAALAAFGSVLMIDLVLAGDNAIVVGALAAGLPSDQDHLAAREHPGILVIGLLLSVALMGLAANFIARIIDRYRWIAYVGLAVILFVAVRMIYEGWVGAENTPGLVTLFS